MLPDNWLVWHNGNSSARRFIFPRLIENTISVDLYLEINSFLSVSAWIHEQSIPTSLNSINDIRQIESLLHQISSKSVSDDHGTKSHTLKNFVKNIVIIPLHLLESFLPYGKYSALSFTNTC